MGDPNDSMFNPGAAVFREQQESARSKSVGDPWTAQGMEYKNGFVGINPQNVPEGFRVERSEAGGIPEEQFRLLYKCNTDQGGKNKRFGTYLSCDDAMSRFNSRDTSTSPTDFGINFPTPTREVSEDLFISSEREARWLRGSGCWAPAAGSMTRGTWERPDLAEEYTPGSDDINLLPIFVQSQQRLEDDAKLEIDAVIRDYMDQGAVVEWEFDKWGYPSAVVPFYLIEQGLRDNGEVKKRLIVDLRCSNAVIHNIPPNLPSVVDIAAKIKKDDVLSTQDLKSGYLQCAMAKKCWHLAAFEWRGKFYCFTTGQFGFRSCPGFFCKRSNFVAEEIKRQLNVRTSDCYVDDYIQSGNEGDFNMEDVLAIQVRHGMAVGRAKCKEPGTTREVLGLMIDTKEMKLFVAEKKTRRILQELSDIAELGKRQLLDTLALAKILGRLVAVEAAIPHLLLLARPLFDDLKFALSKVEAGEELPFLGRESDALIYKWSVTTLKGEKKLSDTALEAIQLIREWWERINGQSLSYSGPTIVIKADASDTGAGGTIWKVVAVRNRNKMESVLPEQEFDLEKLSEVTKDFDLWELGRSSAAREAYADLEMLRRLDPEVLRGARIVFVSDNKGLVQRFWKGSNKRDLNRPLLEIVKLMMNAGASWVGMRWLRRCHLQHEDDLSKQTSDASQKLQVGNRWFKKFARSAHPRPNVDAFADEETKKLDEFATMDLRVGAFHDGCATKWGSDHVLWAFPPLPLLTSAFQNWKKSDSPCAYFCVPGYPKNVALPASVRRVMAFANAPPIATISGDSVIVPADRKFWRFAVFKCSKGSEGPEAV